MHSYTEGQMLGTGGAVCGIWRRAEGVRMLREGCDVADKSYNPGRTYSDDV